LLQGIEDRGALPAACSPSGKREAALITQKNLMVVVELDGCRRIWVGSGFLGTAGDDLIAGLQSKG
jgi:hypothetical protein